MEVLQDDSGVIEKIKGLLPRFSQEKKMTMVRQFIRSSEGFDYRVLYNMCLNELSIDSSEQDNSISVLLDSEPIKGKGDVFGIKPLLNSKAVGFNLLTVSGPENQFILSENQNPITQNHVLNGVKRPRFEDDCREKPMVGKKRKTKNYSDGCGLMKRKVNVAITISDIPQELKQLVVAKKGSSPVFVVQKQLSGSDVDPNKGRLALSLSQLSGEFLTQDEKEFLSKEIKVGGKKPRIQARIFEPCGEDREIYIAKWKMGNAVYSFITTWNQVVKMNSLCDGMQIQLWSFRIDSQLCLFLTKMMDR